VITSEKAKGQEPVPCNPGGSTAMAVGCFGWNRPSLVVFDAPSLTPVESEIHEISLAGTLSVVSGVLAQGQSVAQKSGR
jgi:hypothetical protein